MPFLVTRMEESNRSAGRNFHNFHVLLVSAIVCVAVSVDRVSANFYRLLTIDQKENNRYVDKSLLIDEFARTIGNGNDVVVVSIVRPPGWGKTTSLDMMERFFALRVDGQTGVPLAETEDSVDRKLFFGDSTVNGKRLKRLKIADKADSLKLRGSVPTLRFGFGNFQETNYWEIVERLRNVTVALFRQHTYLAETVRDDPIDADRFRAYCRGMIRDDEELIGSVRFLTQLLSAYFDRKVLLLVDDYDFPLTNVFCKLMRAGRLKKRFEPEFNLIQRVTGERGNLENTLERAVAKSEEFRRVFALFRSFYRAAFSKNRALFGAMICGTFDVEFSDLFDGGFDNVVAYSLPDDRKFADYYGFRESEIVDLVADVSLVRQWHGYNISRNRTAVYYYNARNVRRILDGKSAASDFFDGGDDDDATDARLINRLLTRTELQRTVYRLIEGERIRVPVVRYFPFDSAVSVIQWTLSYLLFRGYLVSSVEESDTERGQLLSVPNRAVKRELVTKALLWLRNNLRIEPDSIRELSRSLSEADVNVFERNLRQMVPHFTMTDKDYAAIVKCLTYSVELSDYFERYSMPFDGVALVSKKIAILLTYKVLDPEQSADVRQEAIRRLSDLSKFSYESVRLLRVSLVFSGRHFGFHYELNTTARSEDK